MAGLDDEDFLALETRDDTGRSLYDLMREENMRISQLLRLKRQYEKQGIWLYKSEGQIERLKALANAKKKSHIPTEFLDHQNANASNSLQITSKEPLPRTKEICAWKGYDKDGNLYWCNNRILIHPRTHAPFEHCGYHIHECVGAHPTGEVKIVTPNEYGLCYTHYVADHGAAPYAFESELLIPGVVFARAGTRKHPLAPAAKEKKKSDDDEEEQKGKGDDDEDENKKKHRGPTKFEIYFRKFMEMVKLPSQIKAERDRAAVLIQARVRALLARRVVERMIREQTIVRRNKAATMMQNAFKRIKNQKLRKRLFLEMHSAAEMIQRSYRYTLWRRKLQRDKILRHAAIKIQRWYRMKIMRITLRTLYIRQLARLTAQKRQDGLDQVRKLIRIWKFHRVIKKARIKKRREDKAANIIQRAWRVYKGKKEISAAAKQRLIALQILKATIVIQKLVRSWIRRRDAARMRQHMYECAATIRRICRGHLGRLRARRQKERINAVWAWLSPTLPREMYAEYLGFPDYDRMFDLSKFIYKGDKKGTKKKTQKKKKENQISPASSKRPPPPLSLANETKDGAEDDENTGNDGEFSPVQRPTVVRKHPRSYPDGKSATDEDEKKDEGRPMQTEENETNDNDDNDDDEEDEENDEERFKRRTRELALKGDTGGASGNIAKVFGSLTGNSLKVDGGRIKRALLEQIAEKERLAKEKAEADYRAMERRSRAPVPMGRLHGPDAPKLMINLTQVAKGGRQPMEPPPKARYETMADFEKKQMVRYITRIEEACLAEDTENRGLLTGAQFSRILTKFGAEMSPRLLNILCETFTAPGVHKVSYRAYLEFAKRLDRPCPVHRIIVCPVCIYAGPCDKCLCKKYTNEGDKAIIANPHSELCECGHHRNRHAPAMKVHPTPNPSKVKVATLMQESLHRTTGNEVFGGIPPGNGVSSSSSSSSSSSATDPNERLVITPGDRAFQPLPLSIANRVQYYHQHGGISEDLQPGEAAPHQEMDDGIGSAVWQVEQEQEEEREARVTGQRPVKSIAQRRKEGIKGVAVPDTIAVKEIGDTTSGSSSKRYVELQPIEAEKYAALEQLVDEIEATERASTAASRGGRRSPAGRTKPLRITDTLPMSAVANLPLTDLRTANDGLRRFATLAEHEARSTMQAMIDGTEKAIAQSERLAFAAQNGKSKSKYDNQEDDKLYNPQRSVLAPYEPPPSTLYNRAMMELDTMTDYSGGGNYAVSRGTLGIGTRGTMMSYGSHDSAKSAPMDNHHALVPVSYTTGQPYVAPSSYDNGYQPSLGTPMRQGTAYAVEEGRDDVLNPDIDTVAYTTEGQIKLAIPRMTPEEKRRRARTPLFGRTTKIEPLHKHEPIPVPLLFTQAMTAGAKIASGNLAPTAETTAEEFIKGEYIQHAATTNAATTHSRPRSSSRPGTTRSGLRSRHGSMTSLSSASSGSRAWSPLGGTVSATSIVSPSSFLPSDSPPGTRGTLIPFLHPSSSSSPRRRNKNSSSPSPTKRLLRKLGTVHGTLPTSQFAESAQETSPSSRAMFTYLVLLRTLALPSVTAPSLNNTLPGYDILMDPSRLLQLIIDHYAFLTIYWRDIVSDIRTGKLNGGPSGVLTQDQRRALGQILLPNTGRANYLDNVFRAQGFTNHKAPPIEAGNDLFFGKAYSEAELMQLKDPSQPMPTKKHLQLQDSSVVASPPSTASGSVLRSHVGGLGSRAARAMMKNREAKEKEKNGFAIMDGKKDTHVESQGNTGKRSTSPLRREPDTDLTAVPTEHVPGIVSPYFAAPASGDDMRYAVTRAMTNHTVDQQRKAVLQKAIALDRYGGRAKLPALDLMSAGHIHASIDQKQDIYGGSGIGGLTVREGETGSITKDKTRNTTVVVSHGNPIPPLSSVPPQHTRSTVRPPPGTVLIPAPPSTDADRKQAYPAQPFAAPDISVLNPAALSLHPALARQTVMNDSQAKEADYTFYTIPGPRPYVCRHPACGETFGSVGAAIRHLRTAHRNTLPLFTSSESDAYFKNIWKKAGIEGQGWVPVPSPPYEPVMTTTTTKRSSGPMDPMNIHRPAASQVQLRM